MVLLECVAAVNVVWVGQGVVARHREDGSGGLEGGD